MNNMREPSFEVALTPVGLSEEAIEQIWEQMKRSAQEYADQYRRVPIEDIALLHDTLALHGLTIDNLSEAQLKDLEAVEDGLFKEYLVEDEESEGEYDD